ncbi:Uncharacterised protein [Moraxella bovis]|uniref:Uncharacterized protein n=1 Tax=Moraxella bovis TaxID=476 RepID=A0A378PPZ2_MORBO|nr:Uncharacterised protein [Moraxella bovis]
MLYRSIKVGDFYFQYFKSRPDRQSAIIGLLWQDEPAYRLVDSRYKPALIVVLPCPTTLTLIIPTPTTHHHHNCPNTTYIRMSYCVGRFLPWGLFLWGLGFWGRYYPVCRPRCLSCWQVTAGRKALGSFMTGSLGTRFLVKCSSIGKSDAPCHALLNIWRGA